MYRVCSIYRVWCYICPFLNYFHCVVMLWAKSRTVLCCNIFRVPPSSLRTVGVTFRFYNEKAMAVSSDSDSCAPLLMGGYDCDFVEPSPESLQCTVCLLPFRDPTIPSCCGHKGCASCLAVADLEI